MPFEPGKSGNPAGRPKGVITFRGMIKQLLSEDKDQARRIIKAQLDEAEKGSVSHFKALAEWIEPALPKTINVSDLTNEQILAALSALEPDAAELG